MRTVTLCMSIRLTTIMHEHLPAELTLAQSSYPETPCHPRLGVLALGDGTFSAEIGKQAGRLQAQLIYQVVTVYYWYGRSTPSSMRRASTRSRRLSISSACSTLSARSTARATSA
jgi:hypothetical protein